MFRTRKEELILKKHTNKQLLNMFRTVLTKIANIKLRSLQVQATADFGDVEFNFSITVFELNITNTTLTIYNFWEVKQSQKLVDDFIKAIKSDDFNKVKAAKVGP